MLHLADFFPPTESSGNDQTTTFSNPQQHPETGNSRICYNAAQSIKRQSFAKRLQPFAGCVERRSRAGSRGFTVTWLPSFPVKNGFAPPLSTEPRSWLRHNLCTGPATPITPSLCGSPALPAGHQIKETKK